MMDKLVKVSFFFLMVNLSVFFIIFINDVIIRVVLGRKCSGEEGGNNFNNIVRRFNEFLGIYFFGEFVFSLVWIDWI